MRTADSPCTVKNVLWSKKRISCAFSSCETQNNGHSCEVDEPTRMFSIWFAQEGCTSAVCASRTRNHFTKPAFALSSTARSGGFPAGVMLIWRSGCCSTDRTSRQVGMHGWSTGCSLKRIRAARRRQRKQQKPVVLPLSSGREQGPKANNTVCRFEKRFQMNSE